LKSSIKESYCLFKIYSSISNIYKFFFFNYFNSFAYKNGFYCDFKSYDLSHQNKRRKIFIKKYFV